jgi:putative membrane protein insertion efficiency factor
VKFILLLLLRFYRKAISPYLGNNCRFHPTCSVYAMQAIEKYGAMKGLWLAIKRIGKCHPLHPGGIDEVP